MRLVRSLIRCFAAAIAGSLIGLVLAALIAWLWLATVDGSEHIGW